MKVKLPKFVRGDLVRENANDTNLWLATRFPEAAERFGSAFLTGTYEDVNGLPRIVPLELNIDFFAFALGGDRRLGHRVVYFPTEDSWWFYDPTIGAFCSTSHEKLEALLSNLLMRCAQDCGSLVEITPLVVNFRKTGILGKVLKRAKALLAADASYFQGPTGQKRIIDGKVVEPMAKPSYELFVEKALAKEPESTLTATAAYHRYLNLCNERHIPPLSRAEFISCVSPLMRRQFGCGLRNDIRGENEKQQAGWRGITLRVDQPSAIGLS